MRRIEIDGPVVIGITILALALGLFGFLLGQRGQHVVKQAQQRANAIEQHAQSTLRQAEKKFAEATRYENLYRTLTERFRLTEMQALVVVKYVVEKDHPSPSPTPTSQPHLPKPPVNATPAPNPVPPEPGSNQGTVKPTVCDAGFGPFFGIDCSKKTPMATTQKMCQAGLDQYFAMNCGPGDADGPEGQP